MASNDQGEERGERGGGGGGGDKVMDIFIFKIDMDFKSMQFL